MGRTFRAACLLVLAPALAFGALEETRAPVAGVPSVGGPIAASPAAGIQAPASIVEASLGVVPAVALGAQAREAEAALESNAAATLPLYGDSGSRTDLSTGYARAHSRWITAAGIAADADAAFDGRAATSDDVLARLPDTAQAHEALASAIAGARSVDGALDGMEKLGVLSRGARSPIDTDRVFLARRLWDAASEGLLKRTFGLDRSWAVPAIVARSGDVTYYIHPVAHGRVLPIGRKAVVALAREIEARGQALYSEQNLPLHYGFAFGKELLDHAADEGRPVAVVAAARGMSAARVEAAQAFTRMTLVTLAFGAAGILVHLPLALALPGLAALALLSWLLANGLTPLERWRRLRWARQAARDGGPGADYAAQWRREAAALYTAPVDPLETLRLHLPPSAGAAYDPNAVRSEAMADVLAASGEKEVHLLAGHEHAAHVAWRLRGEGA